MIPRGSMVLSKIYTMQVYEAGSHSLLLAFCMIDNLEWELVVCTQNRSSKKLVYPQGSVLSVTLFCLKLIQLLKSCLQALPVHCMLTISRYAIDLSTFT